MKKVLFKKVAVAFAMAGALVFAACSDIAENESQSSVVSEESSGRATISGTSSLYSTSLTKSATLTANTTVGNYIVYATSSKTVSIPSITAVTVNGKSLDRKIALNGGGSAGSYRCIGFTTSGSATVTVYAAGASGRYLALTNASGTVLSKNNTSSSIAAYTYTVSSSGTYYLMSTGSGIDIYYVKTAVGSTSSSSSSSSSGSSSSSSSGSSISISDKPVGYASVTKPSSTVTVSNRSDFITYAKKGGYLIYVNGMIDLSNGYMPSSAGGTTSKLDSLVKSSTSSKYSSYSALVSAYAKACSTSTNDKSSSSASTIGKLIWACNEAYGKIVKVNIASNTWIVGKTSSSGLKGGALNISSVSNVVLRNLTIQDAYDPFPHHEANDGYNAEHDCVVIQGSSSNIWVDHCTLKDTMGLTYVKTAGSTSEKWQTYDGLLDMKGSVKNIVVSWNKFQDHDKTMLIGSSDSDGSNSTRTITLHHNYFYNCGQRLPMVRNSRLHMFNNYYHASSPRYTQQYAVGVRKNALIIAENNIFSSGIKYSFKDSYGTLYSSGNSDSSSGGCKSTTSSSKPFSVTYSYSLDSTSTAKSSVSSNAGAGKSL